MTASIDDRLVRTAPGTLLALRAALLARGDLDTVTTLRDAGYAGGDELFDAFAAFAKTQGYEYATELDAGTFFDLAGEFFTAAGWGDTSFDESEGLCEVRLAHCWEADAASQPEPRGCHLTVGAIAAFLGRFAPYPVACLEVEGPGTGSATCRVLAGSAEAVGAYYEARSGA